jgi:rhodanese-related sulfurtransferase
MDDLFKNISMRSQGVLSVTPREALDLVKQGAFIIDLRDRDYSDYKAFDADAVMILPASGFDDHLDRLDPRGFYILSDSSGIKSRLYVEKMQQRGFRHVASLCGGFVEWERDGLPVRTDVNERLSGACACQLKPRERNKNK